MIKKNKNSKEEKINKVQPEENHLNQDFNEFQKTHIKQQTITSWVSVVITFLGVIFIIAELMEINTQNKLISEQNESLKNSITQTYRPLGMARLAWGKDTVKISSKLNVKNGIRTFGFEYFLNLKNKGRGILRFLGGVVTLSLNPFEFRKSILELKKFNMYADKIKIGERGSILMPNSNDVQTMRFYFADMPLKDTYYCNVILFYRDQDGNLYDTEHTSVLKMNAKTELSTDYYFDNLITINQRFMLEKFHDYSEIEEKEILKSLDYYGNEFGNIIRE